PLWRRSLFNSLMLSIGTACFGTLLGAGLAMLRSYWTFPTARWLSLSVWTILVTPSFMMAQGWVLFASSHGIAQGWLQWSFVTPFIFQPAGLIFIMVLSKFPLAYLAVRASIEWKSEHLSSAARLSGASSIRTWLTVQL